MNVEKLKRLQAQVRIGGKGTPRRKKKVTHQTAATDDKKLQSSLKKLSVSSIPGIEEVNIIKDDLSVIHFNNPKAQASLSANTFAITGHGEINKVVEMLPEILPQLGQETVAQLRMFANSMTTNGGDNQKPKQKQKQTDTAANVDLLTDDVPLLVEDFDEIAKQEAKMGAKPKVKQTGAGAVVEDKNNLKLNEKHKNNDGKEEFKADEITTSAVVTQPDKRLPSDPATDLKHNVKEKQEKENIKSATEKAAGKSKDDLQKAASANKKVQNKDKIDSQGDSKNSQKQDNRKDNSSGAKGGATKENVMKEKHQQSNKAQNQDIQNPNKKTHSSSSVMHKNDQQQQNKNQNTPQKQSASNKNNGKEPIPNVEAKEKIVQNMASAAPEKETIRVAGNAVNADLVLKTQIEKDISKAIIQPKEGGSEACQPENLEAIVPEIPLNQPNMPNLPISSIAATLESGDLKNIIDATPSGQVKQGNSTAIVEENKENQNILLPSSVVPNQTASPSVVPSTATQKNMVVQHQEPTLLADPKNKEESKTKPTVATEAIAGKQESEIVTQSKDTTTVPSQKTQEPEVNKEQSSPNSKESIIQHSNQKKISPEETTTKSQTAIHNQTAPKETIKPIPTPPKAPKDTTNNQQINQNKSAPPKEATKQQVCKETSTNKQSIQKQIAPKETTNSNQQSSQKHLTAKETTKTTQQSTNQKQIAPKQEVAKQPAKQPENQQKTQKQPTDIEQQQNQKKIDAIEIANTHPNTQKTANQTQIDAKDTKQKQSDNQQQASKETKNTQQLAQQKPAASKDITKTQPPPNQKQIAPKETKNTQQTNESHQVSPTKETPKQPEPKKTEINAETKKDGQESQKGGTIACNPKQQQQQPPPNNNAAKPAAVSKPASTTKSAPATATISSKSRLNAGSAQNSKSSNLPAESKQNPNPTVNKPKVQQQRLQKPNKPRPNSSSTTVESPKVVEEKPTTTSQANAPNQ